MNLAQSLHAASLTDPGRVRDHNEDCIESRPDIGLYVLADGMGGYNAGEVASGMATSLISEGLVEAWNPRAVERFGREEAKGFAERLIREQIARANSAIFTTSQNNPECAGMGTTLVMSLFYDNFVAVAHIGDSRLYRLRGESMEQVTRDHSLLQEQLDSGLITPEEARKAGEKSATGTLVWLNVPWMNRRMRSLWPGCGVACSHCHGCGSSGVHVPSAPIRRSRCSATVS